MYRYTNTDDAVRRRKNVGRNYMDAISMFHEYEFASPLGIVPLNGSYDLAKKIND